MAGKKKPIFMRLMKNFEFKKLSPKVDLSNKREVKRGC